jgi:hypothetical protein
MFADAGLISQVFQNLPGHLRIRRPGVSQVNLRTRTKASRHKHPRLRQHEQKENETLRNLTASRDALSMQSGIR